jgi:hypothetical protein
MGNVGAKLWPTQVVDVNGRGGTVVMLAGHTLPACGQPSPGVRKLLKVVWWLKL